MLFPNLLWCVTSPPPIFHSYWMCLAPVIKLCYLVIVLLLSNYMNWIMHKSMGNSDFANTVTQAPNLSFPEFLSSKAEAPMQFKAIELFTKLKIYLTFHCQTPENK